MGRNLIPLGLFLALLGLLFVGLYLDPREVPSPLVGKPAPAFALAQVQDELPALSQAAFQGQVSLFNVWASWCVACRSEHPLLMDVARSGRVPIYGLNYKDRRADALVWLRQHGNPYTAVAHDEPGRVGIEYGVYGVPETFVIDHQGIIRHKQVGPITRKVWQETLLPLIERLEAEAS